MLYKRRTSCGEPPSAEAARSTIAFHPREVASGVAYGRARQPSVGHSPGEASIRSLSNPTPDPMSLTGNGPGTPFAPCQRVVSSGESGNRGPRRPQGPRITPDRLAPARLHCEKITG